MFVPYKGKLPPIDFIVGTLWLDTSETDFPRLKFWDGNEWKLMGDEVYDI